MAPREHVAAVDFHVARLAKESYRKKQCGMCQPIMHFVGPSPSRRQEALTIVIGAEMGRCIGAADCTRLPLGHLELGQNRVEFENVALWGAAGLSIIKERKRNYETIEVENSEEVETIPTTRRLLGFRVWFRRKSRENQIPE